MRSQKVGTITGPPVHSLYLTSHGSVVPDALRSPAPVETLLARTSQQGIS
jgi:hypothetical protein